MVIWTLINIEYLSASFETKIVLCLLFYDQEVQTCDSFVNETMSTFYIVPEWIEYWVLCYAYYSFKMMRILYVSYGQEVYTFWRIDEWCSCFLNSFALMVTQQNSCSISHLLGSDHTVTGQWLWSLLTTAGSMVASSYLQWQHCHCPVTVGWLPCRWLME